MLRKINILLEPHRAEKCHYNMASLFHGVLLELVDRNYAEFLHESGYKPFSQFVWEDKETGCWTWTVSFLTEQAWREIGQRLLDDCLGELVLKDKSLRLSVRDRQEEPPVSYSELTRKFYLDENPVRNIKMAFLTPCSFRTGNRYAVFPDVALIYQSLMNKYDAFADEFSIRSKEALQHLAQFTMVRSYHLRSTRYSLEGVKIPSFMGKMELVVTGPETMVSLANLLFGFGRWSGIGIKTALGMGAIHVE